jgi:hypothetical protein
MVEREVPFQQTIETKAKELTPLVWLDKSGPQRINIFTFPKHMYNRFRFALASCIHGQVAS